MSAVLCSIALFFLVPPSPLQPPQPTPSVGRPARLLEPDDLKRILDSHSRWLRFKDGGPQRSGLNEGQRADLTGVMLRNVRLQSANLRRAILRSAILEGADLESADLHGADLHGAILSNSKLDGAILTNVNASYACPVSA